MKLLIVDDEPLMRKGLLNGFRWESMGVQVLGAACNGLEAMDMIMQDKPDIVITDIQMPGMNGLELAERLKGEYPDIAIIFLTGYSDFDYARSAIELQAAHYLLKPIDEVELFVILDKVKAFILERGRKKKEYDEAIESLHKHKPIMRERFLSDVLQGRMSGDELIAESPFYQVKLSSTHYSVAKVEFSKYKPDSGYDKNEYELEKMRLIACYAGLLDLSEHMYSLPDGQSNWVMLFGVDQEHRTVGMKENGVSKTVKEILEDCLTQNKSQMIRTTIGLSSHHEGVTNLHNCYLEAGEALAEKYYLGSGRVISFEELVQGDDSVISGFNKEKLKLLLLSGKSKGVQDYLQEHFQTLRTNSNVMIKNKFMIFDLIAAVTDILQIHASPHLAQIDLSMLENMAKTETLEELEQEMAEFLLQCIKLIEKSRHDQSSHLVERVTEYLNANYMKDINLNMVAADFSVHFSYLSRVFHDKQGTSFTDYLNEVRMRKAKELMLETDLTIHQISKIVGYNNEKYFSRLFKKREGHTSQEFRALQS